MTERRKQKRDGPLPDLMAEAVGWVALFIMFVWIVSCTFE